MAREYFCAYHSYLQSLDPLNDAERGRLFTACLEYSMTGASPDLRGNERFVWPTIKSQIDRDADKYTEFCAKQRANSKMRWDAMGCDGISGNPKHAKEKEKEKEKEIPPISPKGDERFEEFWKAYPKKIGKDAARRAFSKRSPTSDTLAAMLAAITVQRRSLQWTRDGGQYIPNPATWLNQGRWMDELPNATAGFSTDFGFRDVRGDL